MAQIIKKENLSIVVDTYVKDGQTKNVYKTIGELVTYQNDDGSYSQFGQMWGPTGATKFNVFEQRDRQAQAPQQAPVHQTHQAPPPPPPQQPMGVHNGQQYQVPSDDIPF
jgi:single-stranded DNA-binding protein